MVYIFAYFISVFALAAGPFFAITSIGAIFVTYGGIGSFRQFALLAWKNDEKETIKYLSSFAPISGGKQFDVHKTPLKKWIITYVAVIILIAFFNAVLYFSVEILPNINFQTSSLNTPNFELAKQNLNFLFLIFTAVGAIASLPPLRKIITPFTNKLQKSQEKLMNAQKMIRMKEG